VRLEVDVDDSFDYTASKSLKFKKEDYLRMITAEIQGVKKDRSEAFDKLDDLTPK